MSASYQALSSFTASLSNTVLSYTYSGSENLARMLGMDCVEVSAHYDCWPDHQPYQGRMYTIAEFESLNNGELERPIALGVMNCRHEATFCYSDDNPTYTAAELQRMIDASNENVTFTDRSGNEVTMPRYEAVSYVKDTAKRVRALKQAVATERAAGNPTMAYERNIVLYSANYTVMCMELGIPYSSDDLTAFKITSLR